MKALYSLSAACLLMINAVGAPPANDQPTNAEVIASSGPFPYLTSITPDITDATSTGDPELPACQENVSRSIWYYFQPAGSGNYVLTTGFLTATTVEDTVLTIYTAESAAGPFTEIACNDDGVGTQSIITTALQAGVRYWIAVYKWDIIPPTPGRTAVHLRVERSSGSQSCLGFLK